MGIVFNHRRKKKRFQHSAYCVATYGKIFFFINIFFNSISQFSKLLFSYRRVLNFIYIYMKIHRSCILTRIIFCRLDAALLPLVVPPRQLPHLALPAAPPRVLLLLTRTTLLLRQAGMLQHGILKLGDH